MLLGGFNRLKTRKNGWFEVGPRPRLEEAGGGFVLPKGRDTCREGRGAWCHFWPN